MNFLIKPTLEQCKILITFLDDMDTLAEHVDGKRYNLSKNIAYIIDLKSSKLKNSYQKL